jgi:hypothetical protein
VSPRFIHEFFPSNFAHNEASSSGLLIYAATVDLLAEDFLSEEAEHSMTKKDKIMAFSYVLLGGKYLSRPMSTKPDLEQLPACLLSVLLHERHR